MVNFSKIVIPAATTALFAASAHAAEAPVVDDNPPKAIYKAHLDNGPIQGVIEISTAKNGTAKVHLDVTGLPEEGGPFWYHIHENQIAPGSDCEDAGLHFNPYDSTLEVCDDAENDALCQVGDLSGKHGWINTTCFETTYYDQYLSLNPDDESFIGDRSLVLHYNDMQKMACGNFYESKKKFWKFTEEGSDDDDSSVPVKKAVEGRLSSNGSSNATAATSNTTNGTSFTGTPSVESTYCDDATKVVSGIVGTLLGLLVSFF